MAKLQKKYIKMARARVSSKAWRKQGLKTAWKLQKAGGRSRSPARAKPKARSKPRAVGGGSTARRRPGMFAKLNGALRAFKLGLPAIRSFTAGLSQENAAKDAVARYTGYKIGTGFDRGIATATAGFYAGNIIEQKAMSVLRIPQMAGRKKLLAMGGQYLAEIQAASELSKGSNPRQVGQNYGVRSIGYGMMNHNSWLENNSVRTEWVKTLGARIVLGLASRFVGPMINKHLPKGINI